MALSWSVFMYEVLGQPSKACELAKKAFDEAISHVDELDGIYDLKTSNCSRGDL